MSDKIRYPREDALKVAELVRCMLAPSCERIEIAGSLRREREEVGDIELVFIPKLVEVKDGLFDTKLEDMAAMKIVELMLSNHIRCRPNALGSFTWGPKNKLAVHVASRIPIDFFATTRENWAVTMVIRTGPKELNLRLINEAAKRGLKLHAYGVLERIQTCEKIAPATEEELFAYCGVPYQQPKDRK